MTKSLGFIAALVLAPTLTFANTGTLPEGCLPEYAYSPLTGQKCETQKTECFPGDLFSILTGRPCNVQSAPVQNTPITRDGNAPAFNNESPERNTPSEEVAQKPYEVRVNVSAKYDDEGNKICGITRDGDEDCKLEALNGISVQVFDFIEKDEISVEASKDGVPLLEVIKEHQIEKCVNEPCKGSHRVVYRVPLANDTYEIKVTVNGITYTKIAEVKNIINRDEYGMGVVSLKGGRFEIITK